MPDLHGTTPSDDLAAAREILRRAFDRHLSKYTTHVALACDPLLDMVDTYVEEQAAAITQRARSAALTEVADDWERSFDRTCEGEHCQRIYLDLRARAADTTAGPTPTREGDPR